MTHQVYKTKDELKLQFKLLNLSFTFMFLYFMIFQSYANTVNSNNFTNISADDTLKTQVTNNINLISNNDINLACITLKAQKNLNILVAKNSSYKESSLYKSGFFFSKEEITINVANTHAHSKLNANSINLASKAGYCYHKVQKSIFFGPNQSLHEKALISNAISNN